MRLTLFILVILPLSAQAGTESMPGMPVLAPSRSYTVPTREAGEELQSKRGFGDKELEIRMMNLMMVGGSGVEGMDMSGGGKSIPPKASRSAESRGKFSLETKLASGPSAVGMNVLEFSVTELATGKPAAHLAIKVEVAMETMDMGTESPIVREISPGKYLVTVSFTMKGPWAVRLSLPGCQLETLTFQAESRAKP